MGNPYQYTGSGQGFLTDYSGLAAAGAGFQSFADAYMKAKHQQASDLEMEAKTKSLQGQESRAAQELAIKARLQGLAVNGDQLVDAPLTDREHLEQDIKASGQGMKPQYDAGGKYQGLKLDPDSVKYQAMKNQAALAQANLGFKQGAADSRGVRNELAANKQYSTEMGATEKQIMGSSKALSLIEGIKSGALKSTPQLRSDLSAALGSLINQGQPATVYSMQHQDFDSLWGRAQATQQFLTGHTVDSMTPSQLDQLDKDIRAISHELGTQHETKYQSFKEGMPDQFIPKLENRYNKFRQGTGLVPAGLTSGLMGATPAPQQTAAPPNDQQKVLDRIKELEAKKAKGGH